MADKGEEEGAGRLKVFISYSRTDIDFADQLVLALEDKGFQPFLDRHDIDAAENWKERLGALIFSSDTVIFVLSEKSATSPICAWEVEEAVRLGKRMIPVTPHAVTGVTPPAALADLNYIHFFKHPDIPGSGFYDGVQKLERALKVDLGWLRFQTRIGEDVAEWETRGKPEDLLLRGLALQEAQAWAHGAPKSTTISAATRDYLNRSDEAAQARSAEARAQLAEREKTLQEREEALSERRNAERRLRRRSVLALVVGLLLLAIAIPGNYFAALRSLDANARRAAQFGVAAQQRADEGDYVRAMLMSLAGDPDLRNGLLERIFQPEGNVPVRNALVRGYTHNVMEKSVSVPGIVFGLAAGKSGAMYIDGTFEGDLRIWRFGDKAPLWSYDKTTGADLTSFALWPDGGGITFFSKDGTLSLRRAGSDKPIREFKIPASDPVSQMAATSDGALTLVRRESGVFEIWRASDGTIAATGEIGRESYDSIGFSEDGNIVMFGSSRRGIAYGPVDKQPLDFIPIETLVHASMSPDGRYIFAIEGTSATLWEVGKKEPLQRFDYRQERSITSAAFGSDSRGFVVGLSNGTVERWLIGNSAPEVSVKGHDAPVAPIAVYPGFGEKFLTGSLDGTVKLWDTRRPLIQSFWTKKLFFGGAISPASDQVILSAPEGFERWRVGEKKPEQMVSTVPEKIGALAFHPDGERFFALTNNKAVSLWTIGRDKPDMTYTAGDARGSLVSLAPSPDGRYLAAGIWSGDVIVWKLEATTPYKTITLTQGAMAIAFSPDGRYLLVGTSGPAQLVAIDGSVPPRTLQTKDKSMFGTPAVAFSPDGKHAYVGRSDGMIAIWDVEEASDKPAGLFVVDPRETEAVSSISVSSDGRFLLAGASDRPRLFDTETHALLQSFSIPAIRAILSGDGKRVLSISDRTFATLEATDPIVFATASEQVRLACEKLKTIGLETFSDDDLVRFPILQGEALSECTHPP